MSMDKAMEDRIIIAMLQTWEAIGDDCLSVDGVMTLPAEDVIDLVLDANYMETMGGDLEAAKACYALTYPEMVIIGHKALPRQRYGR